MFEPITPEVLQLVRSIEKMHRVILSQRNDSFRPLHRSVADGLAAINDAALNPIGAIRGVASQKVWLCGHNVSLILMVGETETETFSVGFPFATTFQATSVQDGKRRRYWASQFDGCSIQTDSNVQLHNRALATAPDGGNLVKKLEFDDVDLPFRLTDGQLAVQHWLIEFLNRTGIAQQHLGREISIGANCFSDLLALELKTLAAFERFIHERWHTLNSASPPPSRETIAAALEVLGVRTRSRGRRAFRPTPPRSELKRQLSTQLRLRKSKVQRAAI